MASAALEMQRVSTGQLQRFGLYSMAIEEFGTGPDGHFQVVIAVRNDTENRAGLVASHLDLTLVDADGEAKRSWGDLFKVKVSGPYSSLQIHNETLWMEPGDQVRVRLAFPDSKGFVPVKMRLAERALHPPSVVSFDVNGHNVGGGGGAGDQGSGDSGNTGNGGTQNDTPPANNAPQAPKPAGQITTSLQDAKWEAPNMDAFKPKVAKQPMLGLQRTPNGGFVLQPGYYEFNAQSYSLTAGETGPSGREGYVYAPLQGPAEDVVATLLRNSLNHPEISQKEVQALIWAVVAGMRIDQLGSQRMATAAKLLTRPQIRALNDRPETAPTSHAEGEVRRLLAGGTASFAEVEAAAVYRGWAAGGPGSRNVPAGRWSFHPDGYFVRYFPKRYDHTVVEVWVPNGGQAVGKEFDPATHVAVPGVNSSQRLVQSGRQRTN